MTSIAVVAVAFILLVCSVINANAAYHNGVTDGYGYSREPNNPGYAKAGRYLKKYMKHRWPELSAEEELAEDRLKTMATYYARKARMEEDG